MLLGSLTMLLAQPSAKFDAERIRDTQGRTSSTIRGSFLGSIKVGKPLVVRWENSVDLIITSPIVRMLSSGATLYVETANSVYKLVPVETSL